MVSDTSTVVSETTTARSETVTATSTGAPVVPAAPTPVPEALDPVLADVIPMESDGEEINEPPAAEIGVKKESSGKFLITLESNIYEEQLRVRAFKKGSKLVIFKVSTNVDGRAAIRTSRNLAGFKLAVYVGRRANRGLRDRGFGFAGHKSRVGDRQRRVIRSRRPHFVVRFRRERGLIDHPHRARGGPRGAARRGRRAERGDGAAPQAARAGASRG